VIQVYAENNRTTSVEHMHAHSNRIRQPISPPAFSECLAPSPCFGSTYSVCQRMSSKCDITGCFLPPVTKLCDTHRKVSNLRQKRTTSNNTEKRADLQAEIDELLQVTHQIFALITFHTFDNLLPPPHLTPHTSHLHRPSLQLFHTISRF
jgi:hypothetical protein